MKKFADRLNLTLASCFDAKWYSDMLSYIMDAKTHQDEEAKRASRALTFANQFQPKGGRWILEALQNDATLPLVQNVNALDVAIKEAPEGIAFVDVLSPSSSQQQQQQQKGDAAWEQSVREAMAKKGTVRKYSKEEQKLVDAQINKEKKIREAVTTYETHMLLLLKLIKHMILSSSTQQTVEPFVFGGLQEWMLNLYGVFAGSNWAVLGNLVVDLYTSLLTSSLPDRFQQSIGTTALISQNLHIHGKLSDEDSFVPPRFVSSQDANTITTKEAFVDQQKNFLFSLHFQSELQPFDSITLLACHDLLHDAVRHANFTLDEEGEASESLVLVTEILQFNAKAIADTTNATDDIHRITQSLNDLKRIAEDVLPLTERACTSYGAIMKALQNDCPAAILHIFIQHGTGPSIALTRTIVEGLDQITALQTVTDDKVGYDLDQFSFIAKEMNDDTAKCCALRIRSRNHVDRIDRDFCLKLAKLLGSPFFFYLFCQIKAR